MEDERGPERCVKTGGRCAKAGILERLLEIVWLLVYLTGDGYGSGQDPLGKRRGVHVGVQASPSGSVRSSEVGRQREEGIALLEGIDVVGVSDVGEHGCKGYQHTQDQTRAHQAENYGAERGEVEQEEVATQSKGMGGREGGK